MAFVDRSLWWPLLFSATIACGLAVDQAYSGWGQSLVNLLVIGLFAYLLFKSNAQDRIRFLLCLLIAVAGEIFLCKFAGLYTYREGNLPLFVGPGHVLLYATGLWLSRRAPSHLYIWTLSFFTPYACYLLVSGEDLFSVVLFGLFLLMLGLRPMRNLFSVMFLLALAMELYGTWIGNWIWAEEFRFAWGSLSQANPPFASGVLYCGLDFLVQRTAKLIAAPLWRWAGYNLPIPSLMAWTSGTK